MTYPLRNYLYPANFPSTCKLGYWHSEWYCKFFSPWTERRNFRNCSTWVNSIVCVVSDTFWYVASDCSRIRESVAITKTTVIKITQDYFFRNSSGFVYGHDHDCRCSLAHWIPYPQNILTRLCIIYCSRRLVEYEVSYCYQIRREQNPNFFKRPGWIPGLE